MYAQNEFSKTQATANRDKKHGWINFAVAVPVIIGCIILAIRAIH